MALKGGACDVGYVMFDVGFEGGGRWGKVVMVGGGGSGGSGSGGVVSRGWYG